MIVKVIIEPITSVGSSVISTSLVYDFKGQKNVLHEDDRWSSYPIDKDLSSLSIKTVNFDKNNRQIVYTYESDITKQTEKDKAIIDAIENFWKRHPQVLNNGKPTDYTRNSPIFNIVNATDKSIEEVSIWRKKLAVFNKLNEMSYENKVNVCYYYGINPHNMTENSLLIKLGDFNNGVCVSDENIENFTRNFIKEEPTDKEYIINCRKAITLSLIEETTFEGRFSYYLGEIYLGPNFNDVVLYMKNNDSIYKDHILTRIKDKEDFESEKKESKKVEVNVNPDDLNNLKEKVESLKKEGYLWKGFNQDKASIGELKSKVFEAENKKKLKEQELI